MATAAEAVIARLAAVSAVTDLVGTRIYAVKLPQSPTFPSIRVQRVGEDEFMHLRGTSGIYRTRVQVDSVSSEEAVADPVAQATSVDTAVHGDGASTSLVGWKGQAGSPPLDVVAILPAGVREAYDAEELRQYKVMRDVHVWWVQ